MKARMLGCIAACTVVLGAAFPALAGDRNVPGSYSTIQAAVDACASGDVVVCAPGTYTEAVVATKSNITIKGASGAVWDGKTGTAAVTCVDLTGDANVVTGFTFKNGKDHCRLKGDDCQVLSCTSADAGAAFCVVTGARAKVDSCRVDRPRGRGVVCEGDSALVSYVSVYDGADVGIDVAGDVCDVKDCWTERCDKGGYRCKGRDHYVRRCDARSCAEFGFSLEIEASACYDNYAKECGTTGGSGAGYITVGSDNYFELCDAYKCKPHGHRCKGDRNSHYDNWNDYCEEDGHRNEGNDNDCDSGKSRYCGKSGYRCEGDRNTYRDCDSHDNDRDGYECRSGSDNYFKWCSGKWNGGAGCRNGGSSTDVYGCTFLYNSTDVCLGSSTATYGTFSLNLYGSGSVLTVLNLL